MWFFLPVLLLGGCSKSEFLYRNSDWFIERWTDALLDLEDDQKSQWREILERALAVHRETELPGVVAFLGAFENHAARGLSKPVVECLVGRAEEIYRRHALLAAEAAAPLLAGLSAVQVNGLQKRLQARNDEYRRDYLQDDET